MAHKRKKHSATCKFSPKLKCYRSVCFPGCPEIQKVHQMVLDGVCLDETLRIIKKVEKHGNSNRSKR